MSRNLKMLLYGDCYQGRFYQGIDYMTFLKSYGPVILLTPLNATKELVKYGDVLVLPGGADVDPMRYGEEPEYACGRPNAQYEWMDTTFLVEWLKTGKPIIGICRGAQTLNVALGGSLYQDVKDHVGGADRGEPDHVLYTDIQVTDTKGLAKKDIKNADYRIYAVNSYHHQALKRLGEGLEVIGWSPIFKGCPSINPRKNNKNIADAIEKQRWEKNKNGVLTKSEIYYYIFPEIVKHTTKPYIAFQYHPENTNCSLAHYLIDKTLSEYYDKQQPKQA